MLRCKINCREQGVFACKNTHCKFTLEQEKEPNPETEDGYPPDVILRFISYNHCHPDDPFLEDVALLDAMFLVHSKKEGIEDYEFTMDKKIGEKEFGKIVVEQGRGWEKSPQKHR